MKIPHLLLQSYRSQCSFIVLNLRVIVSKLQWNYPLDKNRFCSPRKLDSCQKLPGKHFDCFHYIYLRIHSNICPIKIRSLNFLFQCYLNQNMKNSILCSIYKTLLYCIVQFLFGIELISSGQHLSCPMKYDISFQSHLATH